MTRIDFGTLYEFEREDEKPGLYNVVSCGGCDKTTPYD